MKMHRSAYIHIVLATLVYSASLTTPHAEILTDKSNIIALTNSSSPIAVQSLALLSRQTSDALEHLNDFESPATGCDLKVYLDRFSIRPHGAAPAAATLATYSYVHTVTGGRWGDEALSEQAKAGAAKIIDAWSRGSFINGEKPLIAPSEFCAYDKLSASQVGSLVALQVGRGMTYFVQALDLLKVSSSQSSPSTQAFVKRQKSLVLASLQLHLSDHLECQRYDNQTSAELLSLAMMASYLGDVGELRALASAGQRISLPAEVQNTIYGRGEKPRLCYTAAAPGTYFQIDSVEPGEIVDRFRAAPYQTFGYTLGSLRTMLMLEKLLLAGRLRC